MSDDTGRVPPAGPEDLPDEGITEETIQNLDLTDMPTPDLSNIDDTTAADFDPVTTDDAFRGATLRLLDGEITVESWLDAAADAINDKVDIPWVPEMVEAQVFRYVLKLAGKVLHGFLRGGTANAPTDG